MVKINQIKSPLNFKGVYNNKTLLKSLELVSQHSASFVALSSFVAATTLKPLAILSAPNVDKDTKNIFNAEAFASATTKLLISLLVSIPVENLIKKIELNPSEYFKTGELANFRLISQVFKFTSNLISAIPKSFFTVALIPVFAKLFKGNNTNNKKKKNENVQINYNKNSLRQDSTTLLNKKNLENPVFTNFRGSFENKAAKKLAGLMEVQSLQKFAQKYAKNEKNIARNMSVLNDILLTSSSVFATLSSKKIGKEQKKPLVLNKTISSAIGILAGCAVDKFAQVAFNNYFDKFKQVNLNDPKLFKYIQGVNILRPTIIFAMIYYGLIPFISAYSADKITKNSE